MTVLGTPAFDKLSLLVCVHATAHFLYSLVRVAGTCAFVRVFVCRLQVLCLYRPTRHAGV